MNATNQNSGEFPAPPLGNGGGKYSHLQLAQKYFRYYLTASNGKGHGIHSPFVFDFVKNVLNDNRDYPEYAPIERLRQELEKDRTILSIEDMGAGSAIGAGPGVPATRERSMADLARHAAKSPKLGQLLFRIARYYRSGTLVELGTSLGLSTAYLAAGAAVAEGGMTEGAWKATRVFTIEGAASVAAVAERNFRSLGLSTIDLTVGNFDAVLEDTLDRAGPVDLAYIDGNHRLEPTLRYFNTLMEHGCDSSVLIFDDIHWSREMEEAWESIKQEPRVYLTIDLFFIGLVFFRDTFKVKQDFIVRF